MYQEGRAEGIREERAIKKQWKQEVKVVMLKELRREMKYQFSLGTSVSFRTGSGLRLAINVLKEVSDEL